MLNIKEYFDFDPTLKIVWNHCLSTFRFDLKSSGTVVSSPLLTKGPNWKYFHKLSHLYVETELILADVENLLFFYARECKNAAGWVKRILVGNCNVTIFAPVKLAGIVRITLICLGICELGNFASVSFLSKYICLWFWN